MAARGRPRSFPLDAGWWSDDDVPTKDRREVFQTALDVLSRRVPDAARRKKLADAARHATTWTQAVRAIVGTMHTRADDGREKADALVAFVGLALGRRRLPKEPKDPLWPNRAPNQKALRDAARTQKPSEIARLIQMWRFRQPDLYVRHMSRSAKKGERPAVSVFIHR